jgi:hypothetical protein
MSEQRRTSSSRGPSSRGKIASDAPIHPKDDVERVANGVARLEGGARRSSSPYRASSFMHRAALLAVGVAATASVGCDDGGTLTSLVPKLVAEPAPGQSIGFGSVVLSKGTVVRKTIVVGNEGNGVLTLSNVRLEGAGTTDIELFSVPSEIAPGGERELILNYDPRAPIAADAKLIASTNDPAQREVQWPLTGKAVEPCVLGVEPARQSLLVDETKEVVVRALSTSACTITRVLADRGTFPIVDEPTYPLVIEAGASYAFKVTHRAVSSSQRGVPVREMIFDEADGTKAVATLEGEAPLFGCLTVEPREIFLPETPIGGTQRTTTTVYNACAKAAVVTSAVVARGWQAYRLEQATFPLTVPPNGSVRLGVVFAPQSDLDGRGQIVINTNDSANPRFRVEIGATVAVPEITFFPQQLDFGTVVYRDPSAMNARSECSSSVRTVKVYSVGSAPLTVRAVEIDGSRDSFFDVTNVLVDGVPLRNFRQPFTLEPGSSAEITLQFAPARLAPARHAGRLLIRHDAATEPAVVDLGGRAAADGAVADTFTQLSGPKVDILWVIDNSCSMYDEQARLIQNLSRFVGYADSVGSDYQMAVTVTDSRSFQAGQFRLCFPHPRIIKHDYAQREEAFRCLFDAGISGPSLEAGLGAARQALLRAQTNPTDPANTNGGFLRDDANLSIVVMSDEEDQSIESDDLLRDYFWSIKGRNRVKVHAIAGPADSLCPFAPNTQPGNRYRQMSRVTGGSFYSICEDDWDPVLRGLGLDTFTPLDEWTLSQSAVPASLQVTVDGVPVAWSATSGYTYDVGTNTIRFHGAALPAPGDRIDVNYLGNCRP